MKPTTIANSTASGGVAGAVTVLVCWALQQAHVEVPGEVAAAIMVLAAALIHIAALWLGPTLPQTGA